MTVIYLECAPGAVADDKPSSFVLVISPIHACACHRLGPFLCLLLSPSVLALDPVVCIVQQSVLCIAAMRPMGVAY